MSEQYNPGNQYEWYRRVAKGNLPPMIITVAPTGGVQGKELNPNHPETAEEQAEQVYDAYKAGASMVHVHARMPENPSRMSPRTADYLAINGMIREKCPDIIIGNTTGGGAQLNEEELLASTDANPEVCSLNMGPIGGRLVLKKRLPPLTGRPEDIMIDNEILFMSIRENERFAKAMLEKGIKPEMEVYHPGQWWLVDNLVQQDLIKPPYLIQFVMGMQLGMHSTPRALMNMIETATVPGVFCACSVGPWQTSMLTFAILMGLDVRVGMEDNIYYAKGELCKDNAQMVERLVRIAKELGREIATPKQARQMLGISEKPTQY